MKFEQDHSDHSVRLVGDKHYPDLSGKRIPHLISFVCEMTVQPPPLPRRRRRRRCLSSAAVAGHQLGGVQHGAPGAPPAAARNGSGGLVPTVGGRAQGDATVECFQDHVAGTNPLSAAAKAALAAAFPNREGLPDQVEYDEHSRQERSRGGYFAYVIPTNVRMVGAASAIAPPRCGAACESPPPSLQVDCVVYPESVEEVEAVVALAKQHDVALIPRGGGRLRRGPSVIVPLRSALYGEPL